MMFATYTEHVRVSPAKVSDIERANKMMPGESIHSRKHLVIPVSEKPRHGPSSHGPATIATTNTEVAAAATGPTSPQRERAAAPKTAQDFLSQFDAKFSQTKSSVDKVLSTRPLPASNPTSPRTSPSSSRRTTTLESIHATTLPPPTIGAAAAAQRSVRARPAWVEPALEVDSNNTLSNDDMFEL